jgi:hypothetical protein
MNALSRAVWQVGDEGSLALERELEWRLAFSLRPRERIGPGIRAAKDI